MSRVDFLVTEPHHAEHAWAIYSALSQEHRGKFTSSQHEVRMTGNDYVAVFCFGDLKQASMFNRNIIFGDHGTGLFYEEVAHPSYAGSTEYRDNVTLRLSPNTYHYNKEKETLRDSTDIQIIGVPKVDKFMSIRNNFKHDKNRKPVLAFSFHWDCYVCPETRSSYQEYIDEVEKLSKEYTVIGHAHPRLAPTLKKIYRARGIRFEPDWNKVIQEADIYICDNSSTIFEFAYTHKPVVLLNSKHYRRHITHNGNPRFWEYADIGPQVDTARELKEKIEEAWSYFEMYKPRLLEAVDKVFYYTEGQASKVAVDVIVNHMNTWKNNN